jgi:hypothetical protein
MKSSLQTAFSRKFLAGWLMLGGAVLPHLQQPKAGTAMFILGLLLVTCQGLVRYNIHLARQVAHDVAHWWRQWHPSRARTASPPAWLTLTWHAMFTISVLAFFLPALTGDAHTSMRVMQGLGMVIALLGAYEWRLRLQHLLRRSWAYPLGKFLLTTLAGTFFCITTAQARQFTYALTGESPDAFPTFVRLLSFAFMPLLCFSILCIIAMVWAVVEASGIGLGMLARAIVMKFTEWKGVLTGRLDGVGDTEASGVDFLRKAVRIFRPISMLLTVMWLVVATPDIALDKHPTVRATALMVLTSMDYWPQRVCGHASPDRTAKLDDAHYSIAIMQGFHATLRTESCPNAYGAGRAGASASPQGGPAQGDRNAAHWLIAKGAMP